MLAARWAHDAVYHGLVLQSLRVEMIAFVVLMLVLFMRTVPIGKTAIIPIAAAAAAPLIAVLAIQMPIQELLLRLLKALF